MLDHYLHTAHAAALALNPSREPITLAPARPGVTPGRLTSHHAALAWFEAEHHVLLATVTHAADTGHDIHAWQLPWAMTTFLDGHGHWHQQATLQHTALAAAIRLGDTAAQARALRLLATADAMLGDYDQARTHLADALTLCRRRGDLLGQARAHHMFGFVQQRQQRYAEALRHSQEALALFQVAGDQAGETAALNGVGWCHGLLGDYHRAREVSRQALAIYLKNGNSYGQAFTWDSLGYAEHHLGLHAEAVTSYTRAIELHVELGNRVSEATTLSRLADTHLAAGDDTAARRTWEQALAILDELHHPEAADVRAKLRPLRTAPEARPQTGAQTAALASPRRDGT
jgi:tetratricopeptide (TPR) repeat protein